MGCQPLSAPAVCSHYRQSSVHSSFSRDAESRPEPAARHARPMCNAFITCTDQILPPALQSAQFNRRSQPNHWGGHALALPSGAHLAPHCARLPRSLRSELREHRQQVWRKAAAGSAARVWLQCPSAPGVGGGERAGAGCECEEEGCGGE